jgi:hypothetical protein
MPSRVKVTISGPLFDGRAAEAVDEWLTKTKAELGEQAYAIVRSKADRMNRSGRGGTGQAAGGVRIAYADAVVVSGGIHEGEFSWPWLEGTSKRNQSTPFRGYHAFRLASRIVAKRARKTAQANLEDFIGQMGGEAG